MGKDLNGRELGVGISQKKDGRYAARLQLGDGKRPEKSFQKIGDARRWLSEKRYEKEHNVYSSKEITVDQWFDYWIANYKAGRVSQGTLRSYQRRYRCSIRPVIGKMRIGNVEPIHCQEIMNRLDRQGRKQGTITLTRTVLGMLLKAAEENHFIQKSPVISSVQARKQERREAPVLTVSEQKRFVEAASQMKNCNFFLFALQTGIRRGEILGLTWEHVHFSKREIAVRQQLLIDADTSKAYLGEPKTQRSVRMVPMTAEAERILRVQRLKWKELALRSTSCRISSTPFVFFSKEGSALYYQTLYRELKRICRLAGIEPIRIHTLRHTFATRCIENGMRPKTLQKILGHANISMTMDLYVHATDDGIKSELFRIEESL